ncbi:acetyl-CoA carboxylase carboxyl transferase subunit alpha [Clostridium cavendishii DSM 21758]|uniref:Acetyl-coenzyme A carboxylase carboxyl transferase subunit alpha n=1 Tax=Clostridium cavendishii DSM 21758 TaxID=1121302 RepID=A0A1M6KGQ9_9CLOT|nr:acetyl-CoA carboxylase carboxyltransferase subunit alpha [Clostridium cavendishii]SHJ58144.1 acetyl-CoA carboxylase carboxyl transferase subunit alpha [Clostridium cavendishii DSM 21758]
MARELINTLNTWEKVKTARLNERPTGKFYINNIFDDFIEFHGDRNFRDDKAIVGGIASLDGVSVTVIAIVKGENTKENIMRNFGMPHPEGYRKALRLMKQAEKFNRPIICLVDTPGAFCGVGAEERGQGQAIAQNLVEMMGIKVPIISVIIGEGGSGGALALAVGDKVLMLEHSIYSVLTPEGFAAILWKDSSRAKEAAEVMKLTAQNLKDFKVIDKVIKEPFGGAHKNPQRMALTLKKELMLIIGELKVKEINDLLNDRYNKFRSIQCNL